MRYVAAAMTMTANVVAKKGQPVVVELGECESLSEAVAKGAELLGAVVFADVLLQHDRTGTKNTVINKRWLVMPAGRVE
ncbi:hypothetical protein [Gallaecimonas mangrovi]|uniref:hypothetical protein n=1 Tax=Gallaecimonas mangrovi TaxID=2291597 RepID=UPI00126026EC|nr:hypothetical protein [Gallaecimonas mangrovi]